LSATLTVDKLLDEGKMSQLIKTIGIAREKSDKKFKDKKKRQKTNKALKN